MPTMPTMPRMNRKPALKNTLTLGLSIAGLGAIMLGAGNTETQIKPLSPVAVVGQPAPDFTLIDLQGNEHTLSEYTANGQTVVLEWFSPVCPFVKKHYRSDTGTMLAIQEENKDNSVVWLRINSANADHPAAGLDLNTTTAEKWGITTPILLDPTGATGLNYGAKRTPEMYIINADGIIAYHGAIDNRPDAAEPGKVNFVRDGLAQTLGGDTITESSTKPYGCSIKY